MLTMLLNVCDADDESFVETMFYTYRKQMMYLALSILKQPQDAEDAVHEVFFRVVTRHMALVKRLDNPTDLRNYLLKATKNTCLNLLKKKGREAQAMQSVSDDSDRRAGACSDEEFFDAVCRRADAARITQALNDLDPRYRTPLYYHFVLDLSVAQTAKALGQSVAATKKQLVRGKKKLLDAIDRKGDVVCP